MQSCIVELLDGSCPEVRASASYYALGCFMGANLLTQEEKETVQPHAVGIVEDAQLDVAAGLCLKVMIVFSFTGLLSHSALFTSPHLHSSPLCSISSGGARPGR